MLVNCKLVKVLRHYIIIVTMVNVNNQNYTGKYLDL